MEPNMAVSKIWVAIGCAAACGVAAAQPVVTKPAPSRYYGTARPPVISGPVAVPPGPVHVAPPVVRPPGAVYVPPPVVRPPGAVYVPPPRPVYGYAPRPRVGVYVGPGPYWWGPRYVYPGWAYPPPYPSAYYVPPPVVVSPPPQVVYVERPAEPAAPAAGFWYWCSEPQGWYPQVTECAPGWQPVPPRAEAQ